MFLICSRKFPAGENDRLALDFLNFKLMHEIFDETGCGTNFALIGMSQSEKQKVTFAEKLVIMDVDAFFYKDLTDLVLLHFLA